MKKILFTGFEPFGGESINPSWEAVKLLPEDISGVKLIKAPVCVEYAGCESALKKLISEYRPDAVVCCGQAGGRKGVSLECCAINMDHADIPDNSGEKRMYSPICPEGAPAYFTSAPVKETAAAAAAAGLACGPSFSAGTYVCNHLYYTLLTLVSSDPSLKTGLFIHVPFIPAQTEGTARPSMELSDIAKVLTLAAEKLAETL